MDIKDFKLYGEQRINQIRYAYSENFSEYRTTSSDMEYWLELRENWINHANKVMFYANELGKVRISSFLSNR